jgi:ADP-heptose:LPS heptosyltransferase
MRALLEPLGIAHEGPAVYRVPIDVVAAEKMERMVPEGAIGVIPGSRGRGKRWPAEGFAKVIELLAKERAVVVFGSPEEKELGEEIVRMSGTEGFPRINLAGRTSVAEMVAALARCGVVVGNDTGPLHVAAALGKPVVGLYGKTDPKSVGPYGQLENVVRFVPGERWEGRWEEVVGKVRGVLKDEG